MYKKRKERSIPQEQEEGNERKFSARGHKEMKSSDRADDKIYQGDSRGNSRRKKARTKKQHTGSEILLKENNSKMPKDRNVSVEIMKNKSIIDVYKGQNMKSINYKK